MNPATIAINTGKPTPTLTPIMTLLLTPPVFPLTTPLIPEGCEDTVGTYDTGLPLVALIPCFLVPNATVLRTVACAVAGKIASEPDGTEVVKVLVTEFFKVDCNETGQFTSPVDWHTVAVYVTSVLMTVVVRSSLAFKLAVELAVFAVTVAVPAAAQTSARVV
jgi:hypothetical protein